MAKPTRVCRQCGTTLTKRPGVRGRWPVWCSKDCERAFHRTGRPLGRRPDRTPIQVPLLKTCQDCGRLLPITEFYGGRTRYRGDGYRAECADCTRARRRKQYATSGQRRKRIQQHNRRWTASNPKRVKAIKQRSYERHRDRYAAASAARYRADPETKKRYIAAWQRANPARRNEHHRRRRAAKASRNVGVITPELLAAKFAYWGDRCWMCGAANPNEADHVKPLSRGGLHALANLRPACKPCNSAKHNTWPFPLRGVPIWQSQQERHIWT